MKGVGLEATRAKVDALAKEFPQSAWLMTWAGATCNGWDSKDCEKALHFLEKAVRLKPEEREIVELLVSALKEVVGVEATRARLEALAKEFPQSAWLMTCAAVACGEVEPKDCGKAVFWLEKALRLKPEEQEIVEHLAKASQNAVAAEREEAGVGDEASRPV